SETAVYGIRSVPDSANSPGGRYYTQTWTDAYDNFWLFGGEWYDGTSTSYNLSDLWKYDTRINQWVWVKGPNLPNQRPVYGALGQAEINSIPGARRLGVPWIDNRGRLWTFGGGGLTETAGGYLNDVWMFSPGLSLVTDEDTPTTYVLPVFDPSGLASVSILEYPLDGTLEVASGTT